MGSRGVLRTVAHNRLAFRCPGCASMHMVAVGEGTGPRWGWNGSYDKPTFSPSILVSYPANPEASEEYKEWRLNRRCHSFVRDGVIDFLPDSTHDLAGQSAALEPWPDE